MTAGVKSLNRRPEAAGAIPGRLWPLSPAAFCLFTVLVALLAHAIPTAFYEFHMREPYLLSRSWLGLGFYLVAVLCLYLGTKAGGWISPTSARVRAEGLATGPRPRGIAAFLLAALLSCILLNLYSLSVILNNSPGLIELLRQGRASEIKSAIDMTGSLSQAQPMLIAMLTWFLYRYLQLRDLLRRSMRRLLVAVLLCGMALSVTLSVVKLARYELVPLILQSFIVLGAFLLARHGKAALRFILQTFVAAGVVGLAFLLFSYLRDADGTGSAVVSILGYSVSSFNRLQSVLDGSLHHAYAGTGVYGLRFLAHIPLLHNLIDIGAIMGMPDETVAWRQEFIDVGAAGLNPVLIWVTAPGYLYADFGLFSLFIIFCLGVLWQLAWVGFRRGRAVGVVMYPFMAATVVLWFTASFMTFPAVVTALGTALALGLCERVLFGQSPGQGAGPSRPVLQ
jgi:hypothetical protein